MGSMWYELLALGRALTSAGLFSPVFLPFLCGLATPSARVPNTKVEKTPTIAAMNFRRSGFFALFSISSSLFILTIERVPFSVA